MSEQRNYRSILPITPETVAAGQSKRDKDSPPEADPSSTKKRRSVAVACNTCRAKKLAVSTTEPVKLGDTLNMCSAVRCEETDVYSLSKSRSQLLRVYLNR